jgi:AcrR family transcriptional regulator
LLRLPAYSRAPKDDDRWLSVAAHNRERLLAAANRVFEAQGLDAGVAGIAREAGVGMGTLYRRFPTKDALIDALVRDVLEAIIDLAPDALDQPDGAGLEQFLRESADYQATHRGSLPRLWRTEHQAVQTGRGLITQLLADAKAHERVRDDVTNTDITVIMWSIRAILETTDELAPDAWQRHLELAIAGMRPTGERLVTSRSAKPRSIAFSRVQLHRAYKTLIQRAARLPPRCYGRALSIAFVEVVGGFELSTRMGISC